MTKPPMDKQELIALADAVEKLEGPNYTMEIEIFKAMHPEYADYVQGRGGLVHPCDGSDVRVLSDVRPPNYTASIDAAIGLLPESLVFNLGNDAGCWAYVWKDTPEYIGEPHEGRAATPALSLCAASLRAIASQEGE